jgi:transposase
MLKASSAVFATMRHLVMRLRYIMRGRNADKLGTWLHDGQGSDIHCMRQFVLKLRQDLAAVRNAISYRWSNDQTEGQTNWLKTLKRAMYGRAGANLLRARMFPLPTTSSHTV